MPYCIKSLVAGSHWQAANAYTQSAIPKKLKAYVAGEGSLTKSLIALSGGNFEVNVLDQSVALPYYHEQLALGQSLNRWAMCREVELKIHGEAVVLARSIIPLSLIYKGQSGLSNLGRKPLGHLLFRNGQTDLSKREFLSINPNIYARRTPYKYLGSKVLVSEFFLPRFNAYME